jgi:T4-like virus tail tube protein gp19
MPPSTRIARNRGRAGDSDDSIGTAEGLPAATSRSVSGRDAEDDRFQSQHAARRSLQEFQVSSPVGGLAHTGSRIQQRRSVKRSVALAPARKTAANDNSAARASFKPIILERDVTHDRGFLEWLSLVTPTARRSPRRLRRQLWIEVRGGAERSTHRYKIISCRVSELRKSPAADAGVHGAAIGGVRLEHRAASVNSADGRGETWLRRT